MYCSSAVPMMFSWMAAANASARNLRHTILRSPPLVELTGFVLTAVAGVPGAAASKAKAQANRLLTHRQTV